MTSIFKHLFKESPQKILMEIYKQKDTPHNLFILKISKLCNTTYGHTQVTIKQMEKTGLLTLEKKGRTQHIQITQLGKKIAQHIQNIKEMLR